MVPRDAFHNGQESSPAMQQGQGGFGRRQRPVRGLAECSGFRKQEYSMMQLLDFPYKIKSNFTEASGFSRARLEEIRRRAGRE
jgi:hypothetical protein